jgi:hypothetical protein
VFEKEDILFSLRGKAEQLLVQKDKEGVKA